MASDTLEPWERQPNESDRAFAAFKVYAEMGPAVRSFRKVAAATGSPKSRNKINAWAKDFSWVERARAYDNELMRVSVEERREAIREMNKRHILLAQSLQKKAVQALGILPEDRIGPRTILEYAIQAAGLERTALSDGLKMELDALIEAEKLCKAQETETSAGEAVQIYLPEKEAENEEAG